MLSKIKKSCNRFKIDLVTLQLCEIHLLKQLGELHLTLFKLKIIE